VQWFDSATPEFEKLPLDWRELDRTPFVKLLVIRAMRPDRMSSALTRFVADVLPDGPLFTEFDRQLTSFQILGECFADSAPSTPIYLILSPGSDVVADVDRLARRVSMEKGVSYHNISLGQGQDRVANEVLATAMNAGHWVLLNNVHLMPRWLEELDKVLEGEAHKNFRVFLSSDRSDAIPVSLLGRSIKLTNQPPSGVKANIQRAFASFSQQEIDDLDSRTRSILFGLCYFHAIMLERKKFGPQGFNMTYAFSSGDLLASTVVLRNYMENASATPWEDLRCGAARRRALNVESPVLCCSPPRAAHVGTSLGRSCTVATS
jgi:dynein heavy chain